MLKYREIDFQYADIWRVFISGSSEAGKTYWTRQLLENNTFRYERVYYYHPDIQEEFPVDWKEHTHKHTHTHTHTFYVKYESSKLLFRYPRLNLPVSKLVFQRPCSNIKSRK